LPALCRVLLKYCKGCTLWYAVTVIASGSNKSSCQSNTRLRSPNAWQYNSVNILKIWILISIRYLKIMTVQ
jgi:hypothetical protein